MNDHTETLFIEFNPNVISYWQLLEAWHNKDYPWDRRQTRQYRSAIVWITLEQQDEALLFLQSLKDQNPKRKLYVDLEQAKVFYRAEPYHQNYMAKLDGGFPARKSDGSAPNATNKSCVSGVCQILENHKATSKTTASALQKSCIPE